jgi:hypothetical protein
MFNGRRQPSCDGTSRMTRECQVRICERLGVKFPGPTRPNSVVPVMSAARPLFPRKRTSISALAMSHKCHLRTCRRIGSGDNVPGERAAASIKRLSASKNASERERPRPRATGQRS